ncbi:phosphate-starvation-inducible PsiE family protein [Nitrosomonas sp.]|uniref:phosphate-starvation-inducible PsiE family protein n=1 Tax=Nitrosomonas sp. TaxID=42353 RepID=UPI0026318EFA|nr:phosphate-starvation-inducible PsiE family protein [Nitrosomonas sp.]MCW5599323.1 phosphate-starvation-inducible PsiE family protein [Nitrosomonas sp.]MCW5600971.1 phosphate-starvation-inducible PsiE family protein [Nitrosomonas sp.]
MSKEDEHSPLLLRRREADRRTLLHEELPKEHEDPMIRVLHIIIRGAVRVLAILMVIIIVLSIIDVIHVLYQRIITPPYFLLNIGDILETFGAFLAVLIAIEIFINIRLYLGAPVLPVQLVIATALMAIARKVIVLDYDKVTPDYIYATAAVVVGLGITYWLITKKT